MSVVTLPVEATPDAERRRAADELLRVTAQWDALLLKIADDLAEHDRAILRAEAVLATAIADRGDAQAG